MKTTVVGVILLLAASPAVIADTLPAFTPALAFALHEDRTSPASSWVAWLPGEEIADSYRVYALTSTGPELLDEVFLDEEAGEAFLAVEVPPGYEGYAVTGIKDAVESPLVDAQTVSTGDLPAGCLHIDYDPPGIANDCEIPPPLPRAVGSARLGMHKTGI